jgi:hypothetical protein
MIRSETENNLCVIKVLAFSAGRTTMRLCPVEHIAPLAFASSIVALLVVIPDQPGRKLPRPPEKRTR